MNTLQLYNKYLSWLGSPSSVPLPQHLFNFPFANLDVFEDDSKLINHLFYFVPDLSRSTPRYFFFFEENIFSKEASGDLTLLNSTFHLTAP